jgi:hypothetical protein
MTDSMKRHDFGRRMAHAHDKRLKKILIKKGFGGVIIANYKRAGKVKTGTVAA